VHQGRFGEDYVRVLATAAGFTVMEYSPDVDGVDLQIVRPGDVGDIRAPRIDVQVKTTARKVQGGTLAFDGLDGRQFNRLAGPGFVVPRYLVVVIVPPDPARYADLDHRGLLLRYQGYFTSLAGRPPVPEQRAGVRVHVPVANVLTVPRLRQLVDAAR
jgi:hypothetical protein